MLTIENLSVSYDSHAALKNVNIKVPDGAIVCIIGANGAGKTTLLKAVSGVVKYTGKIMYDDKDLTGMNSMRVAKEGIAHVPEGRQVFPGLTVYQNLEVGTISWHGFFGHEKYDADVERVYKLFPRLEERKNQGAWSLSGGEQQMLAIGRAMMARPKFLLLDEPSMGLAPLVVEEIYEHIVEINKQGTSILLVEQNARLALRISQYAYVIEQGVISIEGDSATLQHDPRIEEAYLGKKHV